MEVGILDGGEVRGRGDRCEREVWVRVCGGMGVGTCGEVHVHGCMCMGACAWVHVCGCMCVGACAWVHVSGCM